MEETPGSTEKSLLESNKIANVIKGSEAAIDPAGKDALCISNTSSADKGYKYEGGKEEEEESFWEREDIKRLLGKRATTEKQRQALEKGRIAKLKKNENERKIQNETIALAIEMQKQVEENRQLKEELQRLKIRALKEENMYLKEKEMVKLQEQLQRPVSPDPPRLSIEKSPPTPPRVTPEQKPVPVKKTIIFC